VVSECSSAEEPHGLFIKTVYFDTLKCCRCGSEKRDVYNWSFREQGTPPSDFSDKHVADPSLIRRG
jgi:hypothetical protein